MSLLLEFGNIAYWSNNNQSKSKFPMPECGIRNAELDLTRDEIFEIENALKQGA
jgi:hypothetical protein